MSAAHLVPALNPAPASAPMSVLSPGLHGSIDRLGTLQRLNNSDVDWLLSAGSLMDVAAGRSLIAAGHSPDSMFIVLAGTLGVFTRTSDRRLASVGPGEFLGDMAT